jgi:hypothetical protein
MDLAKLPDYNPAGMGRRFGRISVAPPDKVAHCRSANEPKNLTIAGWFTP